MPFCPACGKEVSSGAKYCPNCGSGLKGQVAAARKTEQRSESVRELKMRHMFFTALFGLLYAVPAAIFLFRNNRRAAGALIFGGLLEAFLLLILRALLS